MTTATVVRWAPEHEAEIEHFVRRHHDGLIYFTPAFRRFLLTILDAECRSMLAFEGPTLTGVMPILAKNGPFGTVLNSLPFFGSNGGILADTQSADRALGAAYDQLAATSVAAVWVAHPFTDVRVPRHDFIDERLAQWTDLPGGGGEVQTEPSARRNVKTALTKGVTVRESEDALDFLEATHRENMAAIGGRPKPRAFFQSLPTAMTYGRDWRLYVAEHAGRRVAALLTFEAATTVEYVMPVVKESARALQPTAAILARAIADAAARGFTRWNWGGTWLDQEGVYRFKRKWGARERRYRYFITLNDRALRSRSAAELADAYPWFYVLPYGSLEGAAVQ